MRAAKRQWIYAGLAVPEGVAIVRRSPARAGCAPSSPIMLVGDETAAGLSTPLGDLAADARAVMVVRYASGTAASDWAIDPMLDSQLRSLRPAHVLYAMDGEDARAVSTLFAKAARVGAQPRWLSVPGNTPVANAIVPPLWVVHPNRRMTIGTYAAWAGSIWRSLT